MKCTAQNKGLKDGDIAAFVAEGHAAALFDGDNVLRILSSQSETMDVTYNDTLNEFTTTNTLVITAESYFISQDRNIVLYFEEEINVTTSPFDFNDTYIVVAANGLNESESFRLTRYSHSGTINATVESQSSIEITDSEANHDLTEANIYHDPNTETLVQFNSTAYEDKECKLELIVENELEAGTVLRETSGERFYFFENGVVGADVGNVTERGTHFTIIGKELPKGTGNIASEVPDEFKPKSVSYPRLDTIEISNGEIVGIVYAAEDFRGEGIESDDLAMLTLDGDGGSCSGKY